MSEHPELREEVRTTLRTTACVRSIPNGTFLTTPGDDEADLMTDALLAPAGPVGKLQAELADWKQAYGTVAKGRATCQNAIYELLVERDALTDQLADPERIRREAIEALAHDGCQECCSVTYTHDPIHGWLWMYDDCGLPRACVAATFTELADKVKAIRATAASESAVTGEAT